ncbi:MAG: Glyceraldehyde-3-phosphate dehydrogenase 1 [Candidatus Heimdallarchaeota archaeon LC_3]|nr:MAG: Glyceraldehyde-3-phosphate dehydrogenase 1 [Candidatus Heimdallarchaeota archaeon LC_3]
MEPIKVAINGFGRIGRLVTRALLELHSEKGMKIDIVAINDLSSVDMLAHLFEFDSTHGRAFSHQVTADNKKKQLILAGDSFKVLSIKDPSDLPWKKLDVDFVIECTGRFRTRKDLQKHLDAGAKRVILSAPSSDVDITLVRGVNMEMYDSNNHFIISNASCTTNCLAPVCKVLDDNYGIEHGIMTTVHAATNDQRLLDSQHSDFRRARSAFQSMVPTSTGAAKAIGKVLPKLNGKINGIAIRVPTPNVSLVDLTVRLSKNATKEEVQETFRQASISPELKGILGHEWRSLVSIDFNHDPRSAIVDFPSMMVVEGSLLKILSWYDNEWGYAMRTAELIHDLKAREN